MRQRKIKPFKTNNSIIPEPDIVTIEPEGLIIKCVEASTFLKVLRILDAQGIEIFK